MCFKSFFDDLNISKIQVIIYFVNFFFVLFKFSLAHGLSLCVGFCFFIKKLCFGFEFFNLFINELYFKSPKINFKNFM